MVRQDAPYETKMYGQIKSFKVFREGNLSEYLEYNSHAISSQIEKESEDYILNVNETEYINCLVSEFTVDTPSIDFEAVSITAYEEKVPAQRFPSTYTVSSGKSYPKQAIVYHLPYTGNVDLLQRAPSNSLLWSTEVFIEDQCLCFKILSISENAKEVKQKAQHIIDNLKTQLENLTHEIGSYNAQLRTSIEQTFLARKKRFLDKNKMLASIGVPIKKREDLPKTYAIPTPQTRKSVTARPSVTVSGYKPDPTLDPSIYNEILQTIYGVGKVFERLPSTYSGKSEEELRDHLLLYLEPRFKGSATGETFNKTGRTDILIRYENSNVFIAECKFWEGQKGYLDTITQLLGYLTWRDSKAAVVIFVRNKDFTSVLKAAEEATPKHPNYLGFVNKQDESWFNYRFHINNDPNREVKLAVLLFHIPS